MIVDTVVLRKFRAACVSEITVEITAFLPCSLMRESEYNGGRFGCFTAGDVKRSRSIKPSDNKRVPHRLQHDYLACTRLHYGGHVSIYFTHRTSGVTGNFVARKIVAATKFPKIIFLNNLSHAINNFTLFLQDIHP